MLTIDIIHNSCNNIQILNIDEKVLFFFFYNIFFRISYWNFYINLVLKVVIFALLMVNVGYMNQGNLFLL